MLSRQQSSRADRVLLPGHDAMSGVLELEPAAAPASVLESEGMGRERRVRGFHFGEFGHRKRRSTTAAVAAIAAAPRARRGELAGSREGAGRGLGLVGQGHGGAHCRRN